MTNDETNPVSDAELEDEFYVPATFQFKTDAGRIERVLVGLFEERGDLEVRTVSEEANPEFYVPAVFQFSTDPGRIERFLSALFEERGERGRRSVPEEFVRDFYLPASSTDGFKRHHEQQYDRLVPASEVTSGDDEPGATGH